MLYLIKEKVVLNRHHLDLLFPQPRHRALIPRWLVVKPAPRHALRV